MRISDWSADVCSVDLQGQVVRLLRRPDDEGDAGQGQSAGGQRAVEEGAGMNLLALASVLMLAAVPAVAQAATGRRSEERRVGTECVSQCRSRWSQDHEKQKESEELTAYVQRSQSNT